MKTRRHSLITALILGGIAAYLTNTLSAATSIVFGFDTNGDAEGFSGVNVTGLSVAGGFISGTASGGDPRLEQATDTASSTPIVSKLSTETWNTVVFRVRETDDLTSQTVPTFDPSGLVVVLNTANTGLNQGNRLIISNSALFSAVSSGDGFFTVSVDISGYTQNDIRYFRFDPIGAADAASNTFEVDFVQINAIPEPSAMLLGSLGMLGLLRRRR